MSVRNSKMNFENCKEKLQGKIARKNALVFETGILCVIVARKNIEL
jgi:hypothetical protein